MNCDELQKKLALYAYGELAAKERAACEAHMASCATCRAEFEELGRLRGLLAQRPRPQPSVALLMHCRQALDDQLDREELGWRGIVRGWQFLRSGVTATGAVAALFLLAFGFGLGWTLRPRVVSVGRITPAPASLATAGPELEEMRIRGISRVVPDPQTGVVRITLDAERRVTLEGSLDDPRVQQVLLYAVKDYDNPGIRRDTLDVLRASADDPAVRQALLYAMRHDPNPGVRLEALYAGQELPWDPAVRRAFLDALERDGNLGVRVAAIDVLAQRADEEILPVLRRLASTDSNRYVRLKCANALRAIE